MRYAALLSVLAVSAPVSLPAQHPERLGTVDFKNSCRPAVQEQLQSAIAMLHSFRYGPGERAFREVLTRDSTCIIAHWGIASVLMGNPIAGAGPSAQWAERAQATLAEAKQKTGGSQREQDYLAAVAAYWEDWGNRPERTRQLNRSKAYEALAAKYADDDEAQIFAALYLTATQSLSDQTYSTYLKAASTLERQFAQHPNHPGLAHYLIHSYDAPPIANRGLDAARRYASIAPDAPHALHMPSHLFTRVGAWQASFETNQRSAAAATRDRAFEEQLHAMDYQVYAALQLARDRDAQRIVDASTGPAAAGTGLAEHTGTGLAAHYALAAMPARYAVERGDWTAAAGLTVRPAPIAVAPVLTRFARGIGAGRVRDAQAAEREAAELARLRDTLKAVGNDYWAGEAEVSRIAVSAWAAWARGTHDEALRLMRSGADMEDQREKHIVTPGRILPARELLGDLLLELSRPADALREFEASHQREPGRFRGLYGAARSAELAGDRSKATTYYRRLLDLAGSGDPRPELAKAREFLGRTG